LAGRSNSSARAQRPSPGSAASEPSGGGGARSRSLLRHGRRSSDATLVLRMRSLVIDGTPVLPDLEQGRSSSAVPPHRLRASTTAHAHPHASYVRWGAVPADGASRRLRPEVSVASPLFAGGAKIHPEHDGAEQRSDHEGAGESTQDRALAHRQV